MTQSGMLVTVLQGLSKVLGMYLAEKKETIDNTILYDGRINGVMNEKYERYIW